METILTILIPVTFLVMLVIERLWPGRELPKVRFWVLKGFLFFVLAAAINAVVPALLSMAIGTHSVFHLGVLGTVGSALVGLILSDAVSYGVHRTLHTVPFLWRWTHQMHHSAERVDIAGSAYFHPLDITIQIGAPTLATLLLGLSPDAAALAGYLGFVIGTFQHLNVRTPQWLGWIIQRPEAHSVHHARGVHAYNYGNIMLWDILFGTFRNPATFTSPAGFWDGSSARIGAMLIGRDVSEPPAHPERKEAMTPALSPAE
jgi:sterol desaturase/sphingolipid hydroxylase (fatty acid hydroxylase superfamily)